MHCATEEVQSFDNIPTVLTQVNDWVVWKGQYKDNGKLDKKPYDVRTGSLCYGEHSAWGTDYARVQTTAANYTGVGIVFTGTNGLAGVDLDKCRDPETGTIQPWAQQLVNVAHTYTEVSPSGTGLKLFFAYDHAVAINHNSTPVELYDRKKFFTVTGAHLAGTPTTVHKNTGFLTTLNDTCHVFKGLIANGHGDLFAGEITGDYPSNSEADLALASAIWRAGARDADTVAQVMGLSGLVREKWDKHKDYLERTIENAKPDTKPTRKELGLSPEAETVWQCLDAMEAGTATPDIRRGAHQAYWSMPDVEAFVLSIVTKCPDYLQSAFVRRLTRETLTSPKAEFTLLPLLKTYDRSLTIGTLLTMTARYEEQAWLEAPREGTIADLITEPVEYTWVVQELIPGQGIMFLVAKPKHGKSNWARHLAWCVSTGTDFLGRKVAQGAVLWVTGDEHKTELAQGFQTLCSTVGKPGHIEFVQGYIPKETYHDFVEHKIARMAEKPRLVIIDTFAHAFSIDDLNNYAQVERTLSIFKARMERLGVPVLFIFHTNKSSNGDFSSILGSTGLRGATSANIELFETKDGRTCLNKEGRGAQGIKDLALVYEWDRGTVRLRTEAEAQAQEARRKHADGKECRNAVETLLPDFPKGVTKSALYGVIKGTKDTVNEKLALAEALGYIKNTGTAGACKFLPLHNTEEIPF